MVNHGGLWGYSGVARFFLLNSTVELWSKHFLMNTGVYCVGYNCGKFTLLLQILCIPLPLACVVCPPFLLISFPVLSSHLLSIVFFRPRNDASVNVRCIKACQPNDIGCTLDPVHLITHTALSLPTFRDFRDPEGKTRWRDSKFLETALYSSP